MSGNSMIHILPASVRDQIAAGEVVERPASVVKELVENALDARAAHIEIVVERGGKARIQVADDGDGMSREDAILACQRHATSKIQTIEDIFSIRSFGFRGEALAAISSVSNFELITKRPQDTTATQVEISGGDSPEVSEVSAPDGTQITVRDLFVTTPVRLNHLKTDETEYRAIVRQITGFALANPRVSFSLTKDGTRTLDLPAVKNGKDRILQLLRKKDTDLLPTLYESATVQLHGFICHPGQGERSRTHQYLFVNGRMIEDYRLAHAVREAYVRTAGLERHLHPFFVLFLEVDPILVDVNVHPRKTEVRFAEPGDIYAIVQKSVIKALEKANPALSPSTHNHVIPAKLVLDSDRGAGIQSTPPQYKPFSEREHTHSLFPPTKAPSCHPESDILIPEGSTSCHPGLDPGPNEAEPKDLRSSSTEPATSLRSLGQIANKYILAEAPDGVYVFDQHALHERIRFEKLLTAAQEKQVEVQKLLLPEDIPLSAEELSAITEHQADIQALGFSFAITEDGISLSEVPTLMQKENFTRLFQDFVQYFAEDCTGSHSVEKLLRKVLEYKACRGSVMFGDIMKPEEIEALLTEFQQTKWRLNCPHGRPNHVFWSFEELDQQFHR